MLMHDQGFEKLVTEEILNETESDPDKYLKIESDNYFLQYKWTPHYLIVQEICPKYKSKIIHAYSAAGHGKGEADHVVD